MAFGRYFSDRSATPKLLATSAKYTQAQKRHLAGGALQASSAQPHMILQPSAAPIIIISKSFLILTAECSYGQKVSNVTVDLRDQFDPLVENCDSLIRL